MHPKTLLAFAMLQTLFAISPGPAVLLTASHAMARGALAGVRVACGVLLANTLYLTLSALGVGLLLRASPLAFQALKLIGAGYLCWRGVLTVRQALTGPVEAVAGTAGARPRPFAEGLITQLANPKPLVFFGALLPLFIAPAHALLPQYAWLAVICLGIELPVLAGYAAMAAAAGRLVQSPRALRWRQAASGICLLVVALLLAAMPLADA